MLQDNPLVPTAHCIDNQGDEYGKLARLLVNDRRAGHLVERLEHAGRQTMSGERKRIERTRPERGLYATVQYHADGSATTTWFNVDGVELQRHKVPAAPVVEPLNISSLRDLPVSETSSRTTPERVATLGMFATGL
jgi:uncharacterized protein RhaS with RHS repeats